MQSRNPGYEAYTRLMIKRNKFLNYLGFRITAVLPGHIQGEMDFKEFHQQQDGWVHGGVTSTICDMMAGYASYSMVEEGQKVFTVEIKVSYYRAGKGAIVFGEGRVVKEGKRFHFCESEVYSGSKEEKILIAKATATMAVI